MAGQLVRCGCKNLLRTRAIYATSSFHSSRPLCSPGVTIEDDDVIPPPPPSEERIILPKKKKRDKLSILRALSSTVGQDFNTPPYHQIDDPYMLTGNPSARRSLAYAKVSGKKAARYVVESFPRGFEHNPAVPNIEAFNPPPVPGMEEDTEAGILERVDLMMPVEAYKAYQRAKEEGVEVSQSTKETLLELLAAYKGKDPPPPRFPDEIYYEHEVILYPKRKATYEWHMDNAAEMLFKEIDSPSAAAYCSMIRGRSKYGEYAGAMDLFREMQKKQLPLDLATYNAALKASCRQQLLETENWQKAMEVLNLMKENGMQPDLTSFHTLLKFLGDSRRMEEATTEALKTLNEMKKLGLEPSLGCWFHFLRVFEEREKISAVLGPVIEQLEGKNYEVHHSDDYAFFFYAMTKGCYEEKNIELGHKLNKALQHGTNYKLVGGNRQTHFYYNSFLGLLCIFEQIDTIMEHYENVCNYLNTPSYAAFCNIMTALELNEGYQYLPKIWSDFQQFTLARRSDLVELLLKLVAQKKHEEPLQGMLVQIARDVLTMWESDHQDLRRVIYLDLTASMIGNIAQVNLNGGDFDEAWRCIELFLSNKAKFRGSISEDCLMSLADVCIRDKNVEKLLKILEMMASFAHPKFDALAEKVTSEIDLTDEQRNHISDLG